MIQNIRSFKKNMKKVDLAKKTKMSRQHINDILTRDNITVKTLGKIAFALDKKVDIRFIDKNKY